MGSPFVHVRPSDVAHWDGLAWPLWMGAKQSEGCAWGHLWHQFLDVHVQASVLMPEP
jgi:hypothetical protein